MTISLTAESELKVRLFESFSPGQRCGRAVFTLDSDFTSNMNKLFGPSFSDDRIHMAAVPLLLMRAFTTVVANRPPGNIHVGQVCKLFELPKSQAVLEAEVACRDKETKRGRLIIRFDVSLLEQNSEKLFMSGASTIFWAA